MAAPKSQPLPPLFENRQPAPVSRRSYQQQIEELKANITELSRRNMDHALRVLRTWLTEGGKK